MSLQWLTPRNDPTWVSRSVDGYYAISTSTDERPYGAYHIEALWARPEHIGLGDTIANAQQVCEHHRASASAPA